MGHLIVGARHGTHRSSLQAVWERICREAPLEDVRIHAWHPLFEEVSETVRVGAGETVRVELEITPAPQPEPPPEGEGEGETGPAENQPGLF